jgi:hypothetical protein
MEDVGILYSNLPWKKVAQKYERLLKLPKELPEEKQSPIWSP